MKTRLKHFLHLSILCLCIFVFHLSCTKSSSNPGNHSIEGLWIGYYTVDQHAELGQPYYSMSIKPDGTVVNDTKGDGQQHLNIGNWTLDGDLFTATTLCVYGLPVNIGIQEIHTATFNKSTGTLTNGVWKNTPPLTGSGTFTLTKIQ